MTVTIRVGNIPNVRTDPYRLIYDLAQKSRSPK